MSRTIMYETPGGGLVVAAGGSQGLRFTDDQWQLSISGTATSGTFALTVNSQAITVNWNETPASLQTKLANAIGAGNVICYGTAFPAGAITIVFEGSLAQAAQTVTLGTNSLVGGGVPQLSHTVTGTATTETAPGPNTQVTNLALKCDNLPLMSFQNMSPAQAWAAYKATNNVGTGSPLTSVAIEVFA